MKNKTSKKASKTSKITRKNSKTINGIQSLSSGKYRVRKMINGYEHDCTFTKLKDARAYKSTLNSYLTN